MLSKCYKCKKELQIGFVYPIEGKDYCYDCFCQIVSQDEKKDAINHPAHYKKGKVECIEALEEIAKGKDPFVAHCLCTTVKYLWRAGSKEPDQTKGQTQKEKLIEDLEKAKWYLEKAINYTKTSN